MSAGGGAGEAAGATRRQEQKQENQQEDEKEEEKKETHQKTSERNSRDSSALSASSSRKISGARQRSRSEGEAPKRKQMKSLQTTADPNASPPPAAESRGGEDEEPQVSPPPPTPGGLATPRPGAGAGREGQVPIAALFDMISGSWLVGLSVSGGRGEWLGRAGK